MHQVVDQGVDGVDGLGPDAARVGQAGALLELALFTDDLRQPAEFVGHGRVLLDEIVEYFRDF